jgi:hypothetical protein
VAVDWWRAKLVLLAAFFCLDLVLGWQVWRLRVATGPAGRGVPPLVAPSGAGAPEKLPLLDVQTAGWSEQWLGLLDRPDCRPELARERLAATSVQCKSATTGQQLSWFDGLLVYSSDRPVPVTRTSPGTAAAEVRWLLDHVDPDLAGGSGAQGVWDEASGSWVYTIVEQYEGMPLFNARWKISVGPRGVQAQRWWIVVKRALPARPVIAPGQALQTAEELFGARALAGGAAEPVFGYYYPNPEPAMPPNGAPPGPSGQPAASEWYLQPVYQVRLTTGRCAYVDAYGGQLLVGADGSVEQEC